MRPSNQTLALCVVLFLVAAPVSQATVTCGSVLSTLKPCISYLQGSGGPSPPGDCCGGVKSLAGAASSKPDKQTACGCLKTAAQKLKVKTNRAQTLPQDCGVSLSVPISPSVDCSTIS
ncbi:non-specific lipid-transfer protein 4-like [Ipomoea triloba]|uniref:non-specific lipid-transfer protein 4-like n=1 Tax=Ipomoea triloba TaxID=35885 RepID=UPI00125E89D2|nr:non-specific lipid-transfer protein 4-like [Ipomoea triloba]